MKYEDLVAKTLRDIYGDRVECQVPLSGGFADALVDRRVIVEIKATYNIDAYYQLLQYARSLGSLCVRIAIVKLNDLSVKTPEAPIYVRGLDTLLELGAGYYVIPWSGRRIKPSGS